MLVRRRQPSPSRPSGHLLAHLRAFPLLAAVLSIAAPGLFTPPARAAATIDETFAIERLRPATTSLGINDVEWAAVGEHGQWNTALWLHHARDPFAVLQEGVRVGALVDQRTAADVSASIALFDRLELALQLPVVLFQAADTAGLPAAVSGFSTAASGIGDLRVAPKLAMLRADDHGVDVAVVPAFTLPTAQPSGRAWLGEPGPGLVPELAVSRDLGAVRVAGNVAWRSRRGERTMGNLTIGPEFLYRAGVGVRLHDLVDVPVLVDASLSGATRASAPFVSGMGDNPLELLFSARVDLLHLAAERGVGDAAIVQGFAGGGAGVLGGTGTPDFRVLAGIRVFAPADVDHDDDGVIDTRDGCPAEAEDADGFTDGDGCVDADNDQDGHKDAVDRCPFEAEDRDGHADSDGCPEPDNDNDAVRDHDDQCPDVAGPVAGAGCPTS
jgi:hypothetical protein